MRTIISSTLFVFFVSLVYGQEIKHYNLNVDFDVSKKTIDVAGTIDIDFQEQDSVNLVLWKNTDITDIYVKNKNIEYSFDTICKSPNYYIPNGGSLTIKKIKNMKTETIHLSYKCDMRNVSGWANSFSEDWIELGYYTAWYPVHDKSKKFTSNIRVSIDKEYQVSGSGIITRDGDDWLISHNWQIFDNVIIAAKDLKTIDIGDGAIGVDLVYSKFPEKDLDSVAIVCNEVYEFYSSIYGPIENPYLKFVINPLKGGGGYSRTKFVSFKASEFNSYLKGGIAHEMAHFWWNKADATTWEDWLNEAFAEYSKLLYLREKVSREAYDKEILQFKEWTKNALPIWEIDRDSPDAYTALYNKGSLILMEFEQKLGTEDFYKFLRIVLKKEINNTEDFLNLVEAELSIEDKNWFENKLKS
ncbi:MAG: M1 family aminopeptidase [Candidatus Cloacimonadota bacterium]|nr:M1 family aminopeptidase [Candidatus Cloacimonadota bacterium]